MSNTIQCTTNYSIFQELPSNRGGSGLHQVHLAHLEKSIQERNLLHLRPIIVNKDMVIIDGHHRLAIAKKLNLPIYYMIDEEANYKEAVKLTAATAPWSVLQYIKCFAMEGKEEYQRLLAFLTKYKLDPKLLNRILGGHQRSHAGSTLLRSGEFKFTDKIFQSIPIIEKINELIDVLVKVGTMRGDLMATEFWYGTNFFIKTIDVNLDWEDFLQKLQMHYPSNLFDFYHWKNVAGGLFRIYNINKRSTAIDWQSMPVFRASK